MKKQIIGLMVASVIATAAFAQTDTTATQSETKVSSFSSSQVKDIQKVVHDYLVKNPEVLIEVSQILQERESKQSQQQTRQAIKDNKDKIIADSVSPVVGNKAGDAVLVEFFDYQCGHCKAMKADIDSLMKKNPNLKVIFKELPIFGGNSQYAAMAALAAAKQGKYYPFHEALLGQEEGLTKEKVLNLARKSGLDVTKLKKDMESTELKNQVRDNFALAQKLKLVGTPSFIIANKDGSVFEFIPGQASEADMQQMIDKVKRGKQ